jgi:UDP-N-acetylmuramoyl-tripeptide--D-alanyl-D-alanine ligase
MNLEKIYQVYRQFPQIQTDTRKIRAGEIFFALKGPNFNGNAFARQAIEQGAVEDDKLIRVPDALLALQALATHHRKQFKIPFLAITGSNGKTTTKELVHAVLSRRYNAYTTQGNLNNHIGIPLTLLQIKPDAEIAVIEMGANHQKEIESYCKIVLPTHGIITNCGKAHLEGFGGVEGVRKGKGELYDYLRASKGEAFVMWDYDYLRSMSAGIQNIVRYGSADAAYEGTVVSSEPFLEVSMTKGITPALIRSQLVGDYNFANILVAVTVGKHFSVAEKEIISAIESYAPSNSRSQMVRKGNNEIILDAYNANPNSMRAAIENLFRQHHASKIVMIGAMAELGEDSLREHMDIVSLLQEHNWKDVILVGGDFGKINHPYRYFQDSVRAAEWLKQNPVSESLVLVKGSRSMQMEKVMESF